MSYQPHQTYLTKIEHSTNQYRYYSLRIDPDLFGRWSLFRQWGRLDTDGGAIRQDSFESEGEAMNHLVKLTKKKENGVISSHWLNRPFSANSGLWWIGQERPLTGFSRECMKLFFTLLAGFLIGITSVLVFISLWPGTTEVWKSQVDLSTSSGIVIPAGTEFIVSEYMPEGFVALSLDVNVEGDELSAFDKSVETKTNLRIPVWVQKSN